MNIAFAKLGKSIKFKTPFSPTGGDNEAPAIFRALVNHNPDKNFYLVGRSDFRKLTDVDKATMFPYGNVFDCYEGLPSVLKEEDGYDILEKYFEREKVNIDFGIIIIGQVGNVTIPGKIHGIRDSSKFTTVIDMTKNYTTPVTMWMNKTMIPWTEIITDSRYTIRQAKDMFNDPKVSLSQYDYKYTRSVIHSYENQVRRITDIPVTYDGIETAFCIGRDIPDFDSWKEGNGRDRLFTVVLNQGKPSRYDLLRKTVLTTDNPLPIEIYGHWTDPRATADPRFKGSIRLEDVQRLARESTYTVIIPIAPGWVTSKYIEMIYAGCIPFFHPTYDTQHHIDIPDALRLRKPTDLMKSIAFLENNHKIKNLVYEKLYELAMKPEYFDGSFINNTIMSKSYQKILNRQYVKPDLTRFRKAEALSLF